MHIKASILGSGIPVIVAVRNAPTRFLHIRGGRSQMFVYNFFRLARLVIVQCESYKNLYPKFLHKRLVTIANPVFEAQHRANPGTPDKDGKYYLLSVGRLGYQKNYAALIEGFARLASSYKDWILLIVGDGEQRDDLTAAITDHCLEERILLPGSQQQIEHYYRSAHCFALTSRWEGFPNALAEAMAHGLPSVGFSDCAGVNELIVAGHNGLLAEGNGNVETLVTALGQLMENSELRVRLGARSIESVRQFVPENIFARWNQILTQASQ